MKTRSQSRFPIACVSLLTAVLTPARAGEPSARELIGLAPVIESSGGKCQSIDVGGYIYAGGDKDFHPKLRFRALYRAPGRFSVLVSDAADGTPLVFCSGRKMLLYDPVRPTVLYSENASFSLELRRKKDQAFFFDMKYLLYSRRDHIVSIDLKSILSCAGREGDAATDEVFKDKSVRTGDDKYRLARSYENGLRINVDADLNKVCPYTAVIFDIDEGGAVLCLDRLVVNGVLKDEAFAFPAKERVARNLTIKDVTAGQGIVGSLVEAAVVGRASYVRAVVNQAVSPGTINLPKMVGVNWDRVRENDKKYSKALRELIPLAQVGTAPTVSRETLTRP